MNDADAPNSPDTSAGAGVVKCHNEALSLPKSPESTENSIEARDLYERLEKLGVL